MQQDIRTDTKFAKISKVRKRKFQLWRGFTWGLLVLQLNLLGLSAVHHHDDDVLGAGRQTAAMRSPGRVAPPQSGDWTLCPVCQVMRISAARPAVASRPLACAVSYVAWQGLSPGRLLSGRKALVRSRAPPLS